MHSVYNFFIGVYGVLLRLGSYFSPKAKLWVAGRKNWKKSLHTFTRSNDKPIVWLHAASLGEFEQGRPILEKIKKDYPEYALVLSFFSPSGYEVRKDYDLVDYVCYLPLDTYKQSNDFISILQPSLVVIVKYEFWFNILHAVKRNKIPLYLISAIFKDSKPFFKKYGGFFRKGLDCFTHIYVQDDNSKQLLQDIGIRQVTVAGDTRFDRVIDIKNHATKIEDIEHFATDKTTVIIGSSWPVEEEMLLKFFSSNPLDDTVNFIVAPHNIDKDKITIFYKTCPRITYLYSEVKGNIPVDAEVLIIDNIGMLSSIYAYSEIAIIGGGFGAGIHNVLEAAVWGQPVMFGPNYHNFNEAIDLLAMDGGFTFADQAQFDQQLSELISNEGMRSNMSRKAEKYCTDHSGAVDIVMDGMFRSL